jgi:hypothetical protein
MGRIIDLVEELQGPANDLVDAAGRAGLLPRITSTVRSNSEQRRLYNRFLAGQAGYPVAPPGQSAHEYGLAFDMVVSPMEALADVGATWQSWGGGWNPADAVHFELPGASEWARTQGGEAESIHDWLVREYGRIPSWLSAFMPVAATMREATSQKTSYLRSLIARLGI